MEKFDQMLKDAFASWREKARWLKRQTYTVYLACKDSRTPWYAKALALVVIGYACSPVDLIPDFIPILGYLDDLILIPLGITWVIRMIPSEVMAEYQEKAAATGKEKPQNWVAAAVIIGIWVLGILWLGSVILNMVRH
jgi:uncharacterized membrane protein YkvA (DUF1232 family)